MSTVLARLRAPEAVVSDKEIAEDWKYKGMLGRNSWDCLKLSKVPNILPWDTIPRLVEISAGLSRFQASLYRNFPEDRLTRAARSRSTDQRWPLRIDL